MEEKEKSWYQNASIYQIYTLSFKDTTGDGYGDLAGIIEKLDYIRDLGVDAIWLTPFYKSPMHDFGYDVSNHFQVDPLFGYLFDFDKLVSEAHARGIKVIIDIVLNHTSNEHRWFLESRSSKDSPKRDWYIWRPGRSTETGEEPPNNWLSAFGGSSWTKDEETGEWYYHTFLSTQPDLNWRSKEVKRAMFRLMDFWLTHGVDGFRGDAVHHFFEDSELSDEEGNTYFRPGFDDPYNELVHSRTTGLPETIKTVLDISNHVKKYGDIVFISEAYLDLDGLLHVYKNCPAQNHMPFNFNFMSLAWSAESYKHFIDRYVLENKDMPKNYVLGNHDRHRVFSRLGREKALALALLSFSLPGCAFVYYGEEIGMVDIDVGPKELDEWGRRVPGMNLGRDAERGVMQWDEAEFSGFSSAKPWIGLPKNQNETNVDLQKNNPKSILSFYKKMIALRKDEIFRDGEYQPMPIQEGKVLSFKKILSGKTFLVLINMSETETAVQIEEGGGCIVSTFMDKPQAGQPMRSNEARIITYG